MAGVVAGELASWAEAVWAQCQAGTPAPAQAKPAGQTGKLTGRAMLEGQLDPSLLQGRGWNTKTLPLMLQELSGDMQPTPPKVALPPPPLHDVSFLGPLHPPALQPHLEPVMLSVDFWEAIEVVEGLVGGPARVGVES